MKLIITNELRNHERLFTITQNWRPFNGDLQQALPKCHQAFCLQCKGKLKVKLIIGSNIRKLTADLTWPSLCSSFITASWYCRKGTYVRSNIYLARVSLLQNKTIEYRQQNNNKSIRIKISTGIISHEKLGTTNQLLWIRQLWWILELRVYSFNRSQIKLQNMNNRTRIKLNRNWIEHRTVTRHRFHTVGLPSQYFFRLCQISTAVQ